MQHPEVGHPSGFPQYENKRFLEIEPVGEGLLSRLNRLVQGIRFRPFGILKWAPEYDVSCLIADAVAACVVMVMLVPQSMAYALLAGLDPVYGLYTGMVPIIMYSLFTSTGRISPGPVAPNSILLEGIVRTVSGAEPFTPEFTKAHFAMAAMTGIVQLGLAMAQVDWVASLLSQPVMTGFASAAACLIIASQLVDFLGIRDFTSESSFFLKMFRIFERVPDINWPAFGLAMAAMVILLQWRKIDIRGYKLPKRTPMPLVILLLFTLISFIMDAGEKYDVKIVGHIPSSLPTFTVPFNGVSSLGAYIPYAFILAIINYAQTVSLAIIFGKKAGDDVNPTAEMLALGSASFVGSFFQGFLMAGSFTRTAVQSEAKPKTPGVLTFLGLFMIVSIFVLPTILAHLPYSVLSAVVIASAYKLIDINGAKRMWKIKKADFLQCVITFIAILVLDIMYGLVVGIGSSLLLLLYRTFKPRIVEIGRLPGTDVFVCVERFADAARIPHVKILRLDGALHFGNIRHVTKRLDEILHNITLDYTTWIGQGYRASNVVEISNPTNGPTNNNGDAPNARVDTIEADRNAATGAVHPQTDATNANLANGMVSSQSAALGSEQESSGESSNNSEPPQTAAQSSNKLRSRVLYVHSNEAEKKTDTVGYSTAIAGFSVESQHTSGSSEEMSAHDESLEDRSASSIGAVAAYAQRRDPGKTDKRLLTATDSETQTSQITPITPVGTEQSETVVTETRVELPNVQPQLLRAVIVDGSRIVDIDGSACDDILSTFESFANVEIMIPIADASSSTESGSPSPRSLGPFRRRKQKQQFRTYKVTIQLLFTGFPGPARDTMDRFIAQRSNAPLISNHLSIPAALASLKASVL